MTGILDELAKEHQVSLDEYLHSYGMTQDDMEHFFYLKLFSPFYSYQVNIYERRFKNA